MKIYLVILNSDDFPVCVFAAFRHQQHASNVRKRLIREKKYKEDDLFIQSVDLKD